MAERARFLSRRRGKLLATIVALVVLVGGGTAWALTRSSGASYRVATARYASVAQRVDSVGTVSAVSKAVVTFPVSGRVASVPVTVGQRVSAGQLLATLDSTTLQQQFSQAQQTLADDQQKLADDRAGQATTTSTAPAAGNVVVTDSASDTALPARSASRSDAGPPTHAAPSGAPTGPGSGGTPGAKDVASAVAAVRAAQRQLTADQKALDAVLGDRSLAALQALIGTAGPCAAAPARPTTFTATTDALGTIAVTAPAPATVAAGAATVGGPVRGSGGYTYTVTGTPGTSYAVTVTPRDGVIDAAVCTAAIQTLVADLDPDQTGNAWTLARAVGSDEMRLQAAIAALEDAAARPVQSGYSPGALASGGAGTSRGGTGSGTAGAGGSHTGASSARPVTPEQIAADQASVDAASATLAVAQQNLAAARITSPIAGTVAAVGLGVGASAGSNAVTVVGPGAHEVDTTVPLADVDLVKVGDAATVSVDGIARALNGKVTSIGLMNSSTGSSTAYPVTVLLDPSSEKLFDGAGATVSISVASASGVLTVPSSAVHIVGAFSSVTVLAGARTTLTRVTVGAVGADRTQITSGLRAGQQVVLAQLNAPLPTTSNPLRGLGRTLGGTGFGGRAGQSGGRGGQGGGRGGQGGG